MDSMNRQFGAVVRTFIMITTLNLRMVSAAKRKQIVSASKEHYDETVSFLQEMIRTPSVNPPGEYESIHDLVKERHESYGWDCETVRTPDSVLENLGLDPAYPRYNLLSYVTHGDGPTIALNAHFDTVPVDESEEWDHEPFGAEIDDDGRVYGRGANDSKGRIAAYTLAARALESAEVVPENATLVLAITCDEETGGKAGPGYLVESGALEPDYAIVEGNCDSLWRGVSGVRQFEVTVRGKASHAGVNPEAGANAILGTGHLLRAIETYAEELSGEESEVPGIGSPTCVPATIEGGVKTNVVPAECSFTVDHRVPPDYDGDEVEARFEAVVDDVSMPAGTSAETAVALRADPYISGAEEMHVRAVHENAEAIFGRDLDLVGIRGFSDGRFFAQAGAKTLNFGPGDGDCNPHGADENISLDQVRDAGATVAASIVDIARD